MEREIRNRKEAGEEMPVLILLKALLFAYILTTGLLLLLALLIYRFDWSEKIVSLLIIGIYTGVTFVTGFVAGKRLKTRKFIWGLLAGTFYFLVLVILSLAVNHSFKDVATNFLSVLVLCAGSGMLGGMLS